MRLISPHFFYKVDLSCHRKCAELRTTLAGLKTDLTVASLLPSTGTASEKILMSQTGCLEECDVARLLAAVDALDAMEE